jgi:hypothetical protein
MGSSRRRRMMRKRERRRKRKKSMSMGSSRRRRMMRKRKRGRRRRIRTPPTREGLWGGVYLQQGERGVLHEEGLGGALLPGLHVGQQRLQPGQRVQPHRDVLRPDHQAVGGGPLPVQSHSRPHLA